MRIALVVVKLQVFKVSDSASMKWHFLGGFWALTPQIWSDIAEILTRGSTLGNKKIV